jgi:enterochelin esterase family protein
MRQVVCAIAVALIAVPGARAQDPLVVGQSIQRELAGSLHVFTLPLAAGDYVEGSFEPRDLVATATVFFPDGTRFRSFVTPATGPRPFNFVAEGGGAYRIEIRAATASEADRIGRAAWTKGGYTFEIKATLSADQRALATADPDPTVSALIRDLRAQVAKGDADTASFWQRVAQRGTPLVEPIEKDDRQVLVTFLWRGTPATRNVAVVGSFTKPPLRDYVMTRVEGTDVWFLTKRLPSGARFAYALAPNGPLVFDGPKARLQFASVQADPLNPKRWSCPDEASRFECQSIAELPGAPEQPWIAANPSTPRGTLERHMFTSERLKNERRITVYTPPGYGANSPAAALAVFFDAGSYLSLVPTPVILDNLIAAGRIPPTVAVLLSNPSQETRNRELPPNPQFADFLAEELIPWVRSRYRVTNDPQRTVVGGSSFGGIAAMYAGFRHPKVFGNVLCQSGSFWWAPDFTFGDPSNETNWLAREYVKSPKLPLRFWMDAGLFEVDASGSGGAILETSRHMRDVLLAKGYDVSYHQYASGHDYLNWRGTLADGLIALIGSRAER